MLGARAEPMPSAAPGSDAVMGRVAGENFPVASRVLSRRDRRHLLAVYGFARLADELGDSLEGSRLGALDWLERELDRAYAGRSQHPLLERLQPTLRECSLPREPFQRLIEANRLDQRRTRYQTWSQLLAYCELSANPVGELVLRIFELASPARIELSDRLCTALQLTEHWQDLGEDLQAGRVYLPAEDLERFDCSVEALVRRGRSAEDETRWRLRDAVAFEVARTRRLLDEGAPLIATVSGRRKLAVAAFVAGGRAALDAIERAGYEVLGGASLKAGRARRAVALWSTLAGGRR